MKSETRTAVTDHDRAVLRAEIRRLVIALSPYGVLRRDALERAARARTWHEVSFEVALQAAVESGKLEKLPLGFYAIPHR
jgi:hypothetical protein